MESNQVMTYGQPLDVGSPVRVGWGRIGGHLLISNLDCLREYLLSFFIAGEVQQKRGIVLATNNA